MRQSVLLLCRSRLLRRRATAAAARAAAFGYPCLPACNFSSWRVEV